MSINESSFSLQEKLEPVYVLKMDRDTAQFLFAILDRVDSPEGEAAIISDKLWLALDELGLEMNPGNKNVSGSIMVSDPKELP